MTCHGFNLFELPSDGEHRSQFVAPGSIFLDGYHADPKLARDVGCDQLIGTMQIAVTFW
jgi:hypothetical protein